ncbi:TPA: DNA mismatch endonuclease Vsr [Pseudomonas aeruginosa]|nr:DNA mismatch endonuclease Vsr [Pseudomonas aeruginosa]
MSETPEQRSRTMRAVRSRDTGPEMIVRRFLHAAGLRYRLHDRHLPGAPDLVFPSRRVALFVHGCFWHQHPGCEAATRPKSHPDYWNRKLDGNVARDARHLVKLAAAGWTTFVIWECETHDHKLLAELATRIRSAERVMIRSKPDQSPPT